MISVENYSIGKRSLDLLKQTVNVDKQMSSEDNNYFKTSLLNFNEITKKLGCECEHVSTLNELVESKEGLIDKLSTMSSNKPSCDDNECNFDGSVELPVNDFNKALSISIVSYSKKIFSTEMNNVIDSFNEINNAMMDEYKLRLNKNVEQYFSNDIGHDKKYKHPVFGGITLDKFSRFNIDKLIKFEKKYGLDFKNYRYVFQGIDIDELYIVVYRDVNINGTSITIPSLHTGIDIKKKQESGNLKSTVEITSQQYNDLKEIESASDEYIFYEGDNGSLDEKIRDHVEYIPFDSKLDKYLVDLLNTTLTMDYIADWGIYEIDGNDNKYNYHAYWYSLIYDDYYNGNDYSMSTDNKYVCSGIVKIINKKNN